MLRPGLTAWGRSSGADPGPGAGHAGTGAQKAQPAVRARGRSLPVCSRLYRTLSLTGCGRGAEKCWPSRTNQEATISGEGASMEGAEGMWDAEEEPTLPSMKDGFLVEVACKLKPEGEVGCGWCRKSPSGRVSAYAKDRGPERPGMFWKEVGLGACRKPESPVCISENLGLQRGWVERARPPVTSSSPSPRTWHRALLSWGQLYIFFFF